jgi:hypothetical protein
MYRVFYMNRFVKAFATRDEALEWRMKDANKRGVSMDDYEILDRSDSL